MNHKIPLPRGWKRRVRSSVLHILALSHYTCTSSPTARLPEILVLSVGDVADHDMRAGRARAH